MMMILQLPRSCSLCDVCIIDKGLVVVATERECLPAGVRIEPQPHQSQESSARRSGRVRTCSARAQRKLKPVYHLILCRRGLSVRCCWAHGTVIFSHSDSMFALHLCSQLTSHSVTADSRLALADPLVLAVGRTNPKRTAVNGGIADPFWRQTMMPDSFRRGLWCLMVSASMSHVGAFVGE